MGDSSSQRERETETEIGAEQTTSVASSDAGISSGSNYQVFLSFRGPDTREGFTNVLYRDLKDARICVFLDDDELPAGTTIRRSLEQAINNSKIYIPVFSRNYASSQWCLRELKQIVEITFNSEDNKEILPIFLDVKTEDVKLKSPFYRDAIQKLKDEKGLSNEQVDEWRNALTEVGAIKGLEANKYKGYGELIQLVVEEVMKKLKTKHRMMPEQFVKIDDRVLEVRKLLKIESGDVLFIQIYGMGGIGKTTLAKVVFNELSSQFGKCCFLENVREKSSKTDGLVDLQKKLLSEIGTAGARIIDDIDDGMKRIGDALSNKKVLIVLDDVDDNTQVKKLVGQGPLCSGSRILITTRNKDCLRTKYPILDYEMEVMSDDTALELFSRHAFYRDSPLDAYSDLSRKIIYATGRLPLALEVIGSLLYRKKSQVWKETLKKLKEEPDENVFKKLKISYDNLTFKEKQIFLDIACFFDGEDQRSAIYVWEDCDFYPHTGVLALINKSLVKIVENKFWMHDQLRDLGREIVRQENRKNRGEQSRIWDCKEILRAIETKKIKKNAVALDLDLRKSYPEPIIKSEQIARFKRLKYLKLNGGIIMGNLANSLTNLSWILWSHPHPTSNPTNMHLKNVVVLQFSNNDFIDDSKLQSLITMARKLKVLSLEVCKNITCTPDFSECSNLESLNVDHCSNLREIDSSIGKLKCLIDMKIAYCPCLKFLPEEIGDLVKLEHFSVQRCDEVKKLPKSIWNLKSLREMHFSTGWDSADS